MKQYVFILCIGLYLAAPARAEVAYVTDMLQLDMYATVGMTGPSILKLRSGDKLDVIERRGRYALIESSSGQKGWEIGRAHV